MAAAAAAEVDDSFKKAGTVPFKWEIRPGVPKHYLHHPLPPPPPPRTVEQQPPPPPQQHRHQDHHRRRQEVVTQKRSSSLAQPQKLRPPPGGLNFRPPPEPWTGSFRSAPRTRSNSWRFSQSPLLGCRSPEVVSSAGCFPSPLLTRKNKDDGKTRRVHLHNKFNNGSHKQKPEPDYCSDLETLARWSGSTRKSFLSPFRSSRSSSTFSSPSSRHSSPRPVVDAEWAGFGLF